MKKVIPKDQDWVYCKNRLPIDGVDDGHIFIVAVQSDSGDYHKNSIDYFLAEWNSTKDTYPQHDGYRIQTYHFDFYDDIYEGQNIEVVAWREIPEFKGLEGDIQNLSRVCGYYETNES